MRYRALYSALSVIFLNIVPLVGYAAEDKDSFGQSSKQPVYLEMKAKGIYFQRDKKFQLGNVGNWTAGTVKYPHDFDMDRRGGGYEIILGLAKENPVRLEASFEQNFASFKEVKENIIGIGAGDLSVMAFIDSTFGIDSKGFFITAAVLAGDNAPGTLTLKYDFEYRSWRLNAISNFIKRDNFRLDLFAGPVYSRFSQYYRVDTAGVNPRPAGGLTTSSTSENLIDNLLGIQLGFGGEMRLSDKLSFAFRESADVFYRRSEFKGTQDITNGANNENLNINATLGVSRRNIGFVPHLASNINLTYNASRNTSLKFFYQFDFWNKLTRVKNPILTGDTLTTTGSAGIGKENVLSQAVGVSATVAF